MDVLFSQLEKSFFPIRENDFSNWEKINRGETIIYVPSCFMKNDQVILFEEYLTWKQVM